MYTLEYAEEAGNDLKAIYNYIAEDSSDRASVYLGKIEKCILQLQDFPELGHYCRYQELKNLGIRILPFEDYLIFYVINKQKKIVSLVRILHGSANYRKLF